MVRKADIVFKENVRGGEGTIEFRHILSADELLREFEERDVMCIIEYNKFVEKSNALYQTLSTKTFGAILNRAEKIKFFTEDGLKLLREACSKRNYVVHHLFRDDLDSKHLESDPQFYFEELETTIGLLDEINEVLLNIFEQQKKDFRLIS